MHEIAKDRHVVPVIFEAMSVVAEFLRVAVVGIEQFNPSVICNQRAARGLPLPRKPAFHQPVLRPRAERVKLTGDARIATYHRVTLRRRAGWTKCCAPQHIVGHTYHAAYLMIAAVLTSRRPAGTRIMDHDG